MTLLTVEEKRLLTRAASLMDELLETLEVMQDSELVKDLKIALREVEEGKTRPLDELIRELNLENKSLCWKASTWRVEKRPLAKNRELSSSLSNKGKCNNLVSCRSS